MNKEYTKRLVELAKKVEEANHTPNKPWQFQERLNHLLGYIYALEDLTND